jgi:hypothetical protein
MTKKDYEVIAKAIYWSLIQSSKLEWQDHYIDQFRMTARHVANALERENPRFNRDLFMQACGVGVLTNTETKR